MSKRYAINKDAPQCPSCGYVDDEHGEDVAREGWEYQAECPNCEAKYYVLLHVMFHTEATT